MKAAGGVLHCFAVGRTLEQENVDWLQQIAQAGHPLGNHTYDHVNLLAKTPEEIQFRFRRAPWLIADRPVAEVIRENIRLTNLAIESRLGIKVAGFRTPGGFAQGLADRPDLQQMLQSLEFTWVSSKSAAPDIGTAGQEPNAQMIEAIAQAQQSTQPFVYESGLIEVPMSPLSDIGAFRNGRWSLASFLKATRAACEYCLEHRLVFDFLGHPSCLYVMDPEFKTIEMICELIRQAGKRAALVGVNALARRAERRP